MKYLKLFEGIMESDQEFEQVFGATKLDIKYCFDDFIDEEFTIGVTLRRLYDIVTNNSNGSRIEFKLVPIIMVDISDEKYYSNILDKKILPQYINTKEFKDMVSQTKDRLGSYNLEIRKVEAFKDNISFTINQIK